MGDCDPFAYPVSLSTILVKYCLASRISFSGLQRGRQARLLERYLALTLARYHITASSIATFVPSLQHHRSLLGQARKSSLRGVMFFQNAISCEVSPEPQPNARAFIGKGVDLQSLEQGQLPVECKTEAVPDNDSIACILNHSYQEIF